MGCEEGEKEQDPSVINLRLLPSPDQLRRDEKQNNFVDGVVLANPAASSLILIKEEGEEAAFLPRTQDWNTRDNPLGRQRRPREAEIEAGEENIL